ncbi:hypothetical protein PRIPAC_90349 [Pristionchus pacificus]|uniref:ubiquitinyl hydrolase 1 n=1 Tax=Pristionchus pacificus TaxID=54126 RepID=A0A2A6B3T2_PRIPA|nr:hypothetical protein PRIPAC_90349 [Pristionchus pacificus]|eukprot:PDM60545.1 Peptidase [Pristionchus pacificus]
MSLAHVGIYNPGSTCWLACCVHALAGVGPFRRLLYKLEVDKNRPNETEAEVNTHHFIEQFQLTFHYLEEREDERKRDEMSTRSAFRYIKVDKLRKAGELHYAKPDRFHVTRHEDCCEHVFHILQTISEYYSKYFQKTKADAEQNPNRCFAMATTENGVLQYYHNIILPVTTTSFYAALREAWFPKNRQADDKGNVSRKEETKHWVKSLPDVLTFTINRSDLDYTKRFSTFKIELEIALDRHLESRAEEASAIFIQQNPEEIFEMNKNDWSKELYTLSAVIMHKGEGTAHGHYTIFVLDLENSVGELNTDYKYKLYDDHLAPRVYTANQAQWIWSEGNSGGDNCPSMLIYTKNEVLTLEMFSFLEKKVEGRSESMKKAINNMENGNVDQAEKDKENVNEADQDIEKEGQAEKNDVEMEVAAVEPMRKRSW